MVKYVYSWKINGINASAEVSSSQEQNDLLQALAHGEQCGIINSVEEYEFLEQEY